MKASQVQESFRDYEGFCKSKNLKPTYEGYKSWLISHLNRRAN